MSNIELRIEPRRAALSAGEATSLDVLIPVSAPSAPATMPPRGSLNLALVLDRSGSMRGVPLEEAVRCASFVIDQLDERDFASIIVYDDEAHVLVPAQPVFQKETFRGALQERGYNLANHRHLSRRAATAEEVDAASQLGCR